jgi:hypothetical protein
MPGQDWVYWRQCYGQEADHISSKSFLFYYEKDSALELPNLVDMVCKSMAEAQQKEMRKFPRRMIDKCVLNGCCMSLLPDIPRTGIWVSRHRIFLSQIMLALLLFLGFRCYR